MYCSECSYTDGMCYTSNPPQCRCIITGNFHYYRDMCDCEDARILKEAEVPSIYEAAHGPVPVINQQELLLDGNTITAPLTTKIAPIGICASCLVCGEDIPVALCENHIRICRECRKAIMLVKDKFKEELNIYDVED